MTPEAAQGMPLELLTLFQNIRTAIESLPNDLDLGLDKDGEPVTLSCHILADAVARVYGLTAVHGKFMKVREHSWVVTQDKHIIDLYPPGMIGGPVMWRRDTFMTVGLMYTQISRAEKADRYGKMFESIWYERAVDFVSAALRGLTIATRT